MHLFLCTVCRPWSKQAIEPSWFQFLLLTSSTRRSWLRLCKMLTGFLASSWPVLALPKLLPRHCLSWKVSAVMRNVAVVDRFYIAPSPLSSRLTNVHVLVGFAGMPVTESILIEQQRKVCVCVGGGGGGMILILEPLDSSKVLVAMWVFWCILLISALLLYMPSTVMFLERWGTS